MARVTLASLRHAARLLGLGDTVVSSVLEKLAAMRAGARVQLDRDERRLLIAAMYLENPVGFRVDLTRRAVKVPGDPWHGVGDIPGVDTPDARRLAEEVIREVEEALRRRGAAAGDATEALGEARRLLVELHELQRLVGDPARLAAALARILPRVEAAVERLQRMAKTVSGEADRLRGRGTREAAFAAARLRARAGELERMAASLDETFQRLLEILRKEASSLLPAAPPEPPRGWPSRLKWLRSLESELADVEKRVKALAERPWEAERLVGLVEEWLEKTPPAQVAATPWIVALNPPPATPEQLEAAARALQESGKGDLAVRAKTLAEQLRRVLSDAKLLAVREINKLIERAAIAAQRAERRGDKQRAEEIRELARRLQEENVEAEQRLGTPLTTAVAALAEKLRLLVEEEEHHARSPEAALEQVETPSPPRRRGPRIPPEAKRLADYLWENLPHEARKRWRYLQLLQLARFIVEKAREAGVDAKAIDWLHEIDWRQGYQAAKQRAAQLLMTSSTVEIPEEALNQLQEEAIIPPWLKEEQQPSEWEQASWIMARIPA